MPQIQFRTKVRTDETRRYVSVPKINRNHCDMNAFRRSRRFGAYANSDLFPAIIHRELNRIGVRSKLDLAAVPSGVTVDESGFLALVTIDVPETTAE